MKVRFFEKQVGAEEALFIEFTHEVEHKGANPDVVSREATKEDAVSYPSEFTAYLNSAPPAPKEEETKPSVPQLPAGDEAEHEEAHEA